MSPPTFTPTPVGPISRPCVLIQYHAPAQSYVHAQRSHLTGVPCTCHRVYAHAILAHPRPCSCPWSECRISSSYHPTVLSYPHTHIPAPPSPVQYLLLFISYLLSPPPQSTLTALHHNPIISLLPHVHLYSLSIQCIHLHSPHTLSILTYFSSYPANPHTHISVYPHIYLH